jgi:glycosyltransferase involved in cell wall biosynthesis
MSGTRMSLELLFVGALPPLPGGAPISMAGLLVELARRGHRIRAVAPITAAESERGDAFREAHPELHVHWFVVPSFEIATGSPPSDEYRQREGVALRRAAEPLVAARSPDIVLIGRESFAWHVPQLARAWRRPCVLLARGNPTRLIIDGLYPPAQAKRFIAQFRAVDLIVAVARHLEEGLRRLGMAHVLTIPNAVDPDVFAPRPRPAGLAHALGISAGAIVVLHASNLSPLKRPLDLLRAVARLRTSFPTLVCVVVGDGPLRVRLEEVADDLGLNRVLRFTGWVPHERMPEFITLGDLVAMPSAAEGLARVFLETQACGRVLVASDIPAAREVVTHSRTGLLFRVGDDEDLAAQLATAMTDSDLRAAIGREARHQLIHRHGLQHMVSAYERVLSDVSRRAPRPC